MIFLKTDDEIELLRQSNLLVGRTLAEVAKLIKPGVTTKELDKVAEEFIRDNGAVPTFKGFPNQYGDPFPSTLCTSVNDQVVHGIPNDIPLKEGDIVSVVGESENTAKYVGIKVEKVIIRTMLLSGALCGLVGLLLVGGINHTVTTTIAGGQGFTAVLVSWMSKFNPLTMVFSSFLIIFMDRGASEISTNFGLNHSYSDILTGIILFFIIGCEFFITYRLQFRKKAEKEEQ